MAAGGKALVDLAHLRQHKSCSLVTYEQTLVCINKIKNLPLFEQVVTSRQLEKQALDRLVHLEQICAPEDGSRAFPKVVRALRTIISSQIFLQWRGTQAGKALASLLDRLLARSNEVFEQYGAGSLDSDMQASFRQADDRDFGVKAESEAGALKRPRPEPFLPPSLQHKDGKKGKRKSSTPTKATGGRLSPGQAQTWVAGEPMGGLAPASVVEAAGGGDSPHPQRRLAPKQPQAGKGAGKRGKVGAVAASKPSGREESPPASTAPVTVAAGELVNLGRTDQSLLAAIFGEAFPEGVQLRGQQVPQTEEARRIVTKAAASAREALAAVWSEWDGARVSWSPAGTAMIAAVATALEEGQVPDAGTAAAMALGEAGGVKGVKARATLEASLGVAVKQFRRLPEGRQTFPHSIEVNNEPYFGGEWRKRPYERKAYERIEEYVPAGAAADEGPVAGKLRTGKHGGCDGSGCQRNNLQVNKFFGGRIETDHPCLSRNTECDETCACDPSICPNRGVHGGSVIDYGADLEERDVWGFDCYTRRNIEDAVIECGVFGAGVPIPSEKDKPARDLCGPEAIDRTAAFVDDVLMPAINANKTERPWDLRTTLDALIEGNDGPGVKEACRAIRDRIENSGLNYFRIHPKGCGVICVKEGGIEKATFVSRYLGEVYLSSRWFELQDAIKKFNPRQALNDFYNIVLERPKDDPAGYDVLFVDAAYKGAIASRISHSCVPNCEANVVSSNGKLSIAIYTSRHIKKGEELSFDYSCVTESLVEYREAICLCGKERCRGSFLSLADGSAYNDVMNTHHNFLHRNAILLKSCVEPVSAEDRNRLARFGFKSSLLGFRGGDLPDWVLKWLSYTLQYIEEEEKILPDSLVAKYPHIYRSLEQAKIEAQGVRDQRIQNLAITVDKVKLILLQQGEDTHPPLRPLTERERIDHLWTGRDSFARRFFRDKDFSSKLRQAANSEDPAARAGLSGVDALRKRLEDQSRWPASSEEARGLLAEMAAHLCTIDERRGCRSFKSVADLIKMTARAETLFTLNKYKSVGMPDIIKKKHIQYMDNSQSTTTLLKRLDNEDFVPGTGKKYNQTFLWGQLMYWFKQTIYEPNASLSADRRGTISLPDLESAVRTYTEKDRINLRKTLSESPHKMWKTGTIWSFRNPNKVYGSPWLEAALREPFREIQIEKDLQAIFS